MLSFDRVPIQLRMWRIIGLGGKKCRKKAKKDDMEAAKEEFQLITTEKFVIRFFTRETLYVRANAWSTNRRYT